MPQHHHNRLLVTAVIETIVTAGDNASLKKPNKKHSDADMTIW
jgi:hypothetical protein